MSELARAALSSLIVTTIACGAPAAPTGPTTGPRAAPAASSAEPSGSITSAARSDARTARPAPRAQAISSATAIAAPSERSPPIHVYAGSFPPPVDDACANPSIEAVEAARDTYREAVRHLEASQAAAAASAFEQAYRIACSAPSVLLHLARAHEAAGAIKPAIQAYELFLQRGAPDAEQARDVNACLANLRAKKP